MRLCRFNGDHYGIVIDGGVRDVTPVVCRSVGTFQLPLPTFDPVIAAMAELTPQIADTTKHAPELPLDSVRFLSPVAHPGEIAAAPLSYLKHFEEVRLNDDLHHGAQAYMNEVHNVGLFLKATSSPIGVFESVQLRFRDRRNDHEVEGVGRVQLGDLITASIERISTIEVSGT